MAKYLSLDGLTTLVSKIKTLITTSISTKADKLETAVSGQVLIDDGNGNLSGSSKSIGGSTLAETPDENTLATEVAVATALQSEFNQKLGDIESVLASVVEV